MNAKELIEKVQNDASEWIEMSDDPYRVVCNVLANQVISLKSYIQYLERRVDHDNKRHATRQ